MAVGHQLFLGEHTTPYQGVHHSGIHQIMVVAQQGFQVGHTDVSLIKQTLDEGQCVGLLVQSPAQGFHLYGIVVFGHRVAVYGLGWVAVPCGFVVFAGVVIGWRRTTTLQSGCGPFFFPLKRSHDLECRDWSQ